MTIFDKEDEPSTGAREIRVRSGILILCSAAASHDQVRRKAIPITSTGMIVRVNFNLRGWVYLELDFVPYPGPKAR